ncbi:predicted protein [Chaetoceros tenuissimus]|uniref:Uncharacterized protein n=1 Tax=Chaetoceros tenuissimus TaxID=426638 RepID=A0AAD3CW14_9STRA|nr:predicted protein [Chaetoceros tenuissimus]
MSILPTNLILAACVLVAQIFGAYAKTTRTVQLIPFTLELTATSVTTSNSFDIIETWTQEHLENFILSKNDDEVWSKLGSLSLTMEKRYFKDLLSGLGKDDFTMIATFEGQMNFIDDVEQPSNTDLGFIQWEAFIGQAKLDYLTGLRAKSTNRFLQSVNNAKVSWTPASKSNLGTILLASLVGVIIAISLILVFVYVNKCRRKKRQNERRKKRQEGKHAGRDLELAETGSFSPVNSPREFEDDEKPMFYDEAASVKMGNSIVTKDTIDVKTGRDMLAWKHNGTPHRPFDLEVSRISKSVEVKKKKKSDQNPFEVDVSRITKTEKSVVSKTETVDMNISSDMLAWKHQKNSKPFDVDVTGISMESTNKTMIVDVGKKKKSKTSAGSQRQEVGYLSKGALNNHNQTKFQEHAKRYAEKNKRSKRR